MPSLRTLLLTGCLALSPLPGSAPASAGQSDLLRFEHENLRTGQAETLETMRGEASLLLFFQPDCRWCLRQTRVLDELLETCPHALNAAALGVHADRMGLKAELRRLRPDFSAYMTGREMLSELQGVPATPIMLLTDKNGGFLQAFRGYVPAEELSGILATRHGVTCTL